MCVVTERSYTNPTKGQRQLGRTLLRRHHHSVLVLPLRKLRRGKHVAVVTVNGTRTKWSFRAP